MQVKAQILVLPRGLKRPITEQGRNLHVILTVGRQHQELKHWPRTVEKPFVGGCEVEFTLIYLLNKLF